MITLPVSSAFLISVKLSPFPADSIRLLALLISHLGTRWKKQCEKCVGANVNFSHRAHGLSRFLDR